MSAYEDWRDRNRAIERERFWSKVDASAGTDGCWPWIAGRNRQHGAHQYGSFALRDGNGKPKMGLAHRIAYEFLIGPIPAGLTIDHLCKNTLCCNPAHMEAVTQGENVRRGDSIFAQNARKTHCIRGHELSGENLYVWRGGRQCRACQRDRERARRAS